MTDVLLDIHRPIPFDFFSATLGAVAVAAGVFHLVRRERAPAGGARVSPGAARAIRGAGRVGSALLGLFYIVIGGGVAAWFVVAPHLRAARLRAASTSPSATTSEGIVSGFRDDPGHRAVSWTLVTDGDARTFAFSESALGVGMHAYDRLRGALRDGQRLRVVDVGGVLVRVEVP